MRFFQKTKDGGPDSTVEAYFLFEIKWLCSIALLKFNKGSRTNYHTHAFNALTWFIKGSMTEIRLADLGQELAEYRHSIIPKVTRKDNLHKVVAHKTSWCFTIRGPWDKHWKEVDLDAGIEYNLTHGRQVLSTIEREK